MDDNGEEDSEGGFEIHELVFAESIGVNLEEEFAAELLEIAVKALYTLPEDWVIEISESAELGKIPFFYNQVTGESQWTHPFMEEFANVVKEHRMELYQGYIEGEEEDYRGEEEDEILVSEEDMKKDIEQHQVTLLDQPMNGISQVSKQFDKFIDDDDKNEYVEVKSPLRESAKATPRLEEVQLSSPEEVKVNKEEKELAGNEVILPISSNEDFVGPPIESPLSVKVAQTGNPRKLRISRASLSLRTDLSVSQEDLVQINEKFLATAEHISVSQQVEKTTVEKEIVVETVKPKRPVSRPSRPDSAVEEQDPIEKPAAKSIAKNNTPEDQEDTAQARDGELPIMDIGTTFAVSTEYDGHSYQERPLVAMDDNSTVATGDELASLLDRPTEILDDCPVKVLTKKDSSERALINMALGADLFGSEPASVVGSFAGTVSASAVASVAISAAPLDEVSLQGEFQLVDDVSSVVSAVTADELLAAPSADCEPSADKQPAMAELRLDAVETTKGEESPIVETNKLVAETKTEIFDVAHKNKFVFVDTFPDFFKVESNFLEMVEAKEGEHDINSNKNQDIDRLLAAVLHGDGDDLKNFNLANGEVEIENVDEDDDGSQVTQKRNEKFDDHELVEIANKKTIKIKDECEDDVEMFSSTVQVGQIMKPTITSVSDIAEDDNDLVVQTSGMDMQMEDLEKTTAKEPRLLNILDDQRFQGSHKPVEPLDKNIDVADHFAQLFQGSTLITTADGPATNSTNPSTKPSARGRPEGEEAKRATIVDSRPSESPSVISRVSSAKGGNAKWMSKQPISTNDGTQSNNNAVKVNIPRKSSANKKRVTSGSRKWVTLGKYGSYREANLATKLFESIYPSQSFVDKSFPIFSAKDQEECDAANSSGADDVTNPNGGSRLALLMMMDGNVDTKTMQRSIGKEIPKLRISRDLSRMQWLVECSDPQAKKVFQGKVAHKRALSPLRSGPQLPTSTLTDSISLTQGSIMGNSIDCLDMGVGIAAQSSVFTAPFSPRRLLTTTNNSYHLSYRFPLVYPGPSLHSTHHSMTMSTTSINNNSTDRHGSAKKRVFSAGRLSMLPQTPSDGNITVTSLHGEPLSSEMLNRFPSLIDKPFAPKTFRHVLRNGSISVGNRPHSSR